MIISDRDLPFRLRAPETGTWAERAMKTRSLGTIAITVASWCGGLNECCGGGVVHIRKLTGMFGARFMMAIARREGEYLPVHTCLALCEWLIYVRKRWMVRLGVPGIVKFSYHCNLVSPGGWTKRLSEACTWKCCSVSSTWVEVVPSPIEAKKLRAGSIGVHA